MALNNDFKVKNNLNTLGKILSGGTDIAEIFAASNTSWTLSAVNANFNISGGETFTLFGNNGIDVRANSTTESVTISGINATTTTRGVASFNTLSFDVTNGAVSVKTGGITNAQLAGSIEDSKLNTISTPGKVANSATTATSANDPNTIVLRNANGNFNAGTITAVTLSTQGGTSTQWNSTYTTVLANSATTWNYQGTDLKALSANWQGTYTNVQSNSANWNTAYSTIQATSAIGSLTSTVTTDLSVGGISAAQVLPAGTTFQDFVEQLFVKTFFPTFTAPSISTVSSNIGTSVEAGTTGLTLTVTFLSGSINGETVNGIWNPNLVQNTRSGLLTGGQIFGTQINSRTTFNTIAATSGTRIIIDGNNTFSVRADYEQGPQPKDSRGNNFDSPLPAGNVPNSITVVGRRRGFWGAETGPTGAPTTSNEIRALPTSQLNPAVNTSYTINVPVGSTRITFAYPATLGLANGSGSEPAFKDMTNNFDYTSEFGSPTTVSVEGANGFNAINYNVYSYTPAVPIPGEFSLRLII